MTAIEALARQLGLQVTARLVSEAAEFDGAFAASVVDHDQAMLVQASPLTVKNQPAWSRLQHNPFAAIYERRNFVESGGLLSYGQVWRENFERAAALVDKILKGPNPPTCRSSSRPSSSWWSTPRPRRRSA